MGGGYGRKVGEDIGIEERGGRGVCMCLVCVVVVVCSMFDVFQLCLLWGRSARGESFWTSPKFENLKI